MELECSDNEIIFRNSFLINPAAWVQSSNAAFSLSGCGRTHHAVYKIETCKPLEF
jgi:hypothetical protein